MLEYHNRWNDNEFHSNRGTPAEICKELSENDEVGSFFDYVTKYVLWDDVLDWERDIKDYERRGSAYNRRNTVLRCGNLRSFTLSKLL